MKDLTTSAIDRQNILNNSFAIEELQKHIGLSGMLFNNEYRFTRQQVASFYEVDIRTINRYLSTYEDELRHNGYEVLKSDVLSAFKTSFAHLLPPEVLNSSQLAVFNFRAFLNLGMLLVESVSAKALRSRMLDIVIDVLNSKTGGSTKYVNQRDEDFLVAISREPLYRREFTSALNKYLNMGNYKYEFYTDAIYKAVFDGKAAEYKKLLKLDAKENPRDTMYAEVLTLISSFEVGIAEEMQAESDKLGRKLEPPELDTIISIFSKKRFWEPQLHDARSKMASRDYTLRDITHKRLEPYIGALSAKDYERFLGKKSKDLAERIEENIDVFRRLKDR